jgi:putative salt-induced outer membrane protein YdiY
MLIRIGQLFSLFVIGLTLSAAVLCAQDEGYAPLLRLPPPSDEDSVAAPVAAATPPAIAADRGDLAAWSAGQVLGDTSFWNSMWDPWEGNVELGMNGTSGNTDTFNVRVGATGKYKTETRTHSLQLVYLEKNANSVQTAQTGLGDARIEWPMAGSPWNYFIHSLVEFDQFKAINTRVSADTGFGFEFIENDITTLIGRLGISTSREIGGPEDKFIPELLAGVEYKHKFNDKHSISFKADYYPSIKDAKDFRINSQASWEMAVAPEWGLSLKFSVIDRYDSTPHGSKPNDLDYSTLLIWAF